MNENQTAAPDPIGLLLSEQRERWQRGERPMLETLLQEHAGLKSDTQGMLDLLFHEFTLRANGGENPSLDEYARRFPELAEQFRVLLELHRIFPEQPLAGTVDQVEPSHEANDRATIVQPAADVGQAAIEPGAVIAGRYKLLQKIGEGSMGAVWMADQIGDVKRRVALKVIHAERGSSKSILARFEAERQAIAMMDHPNIARLLDAGSTGGERGGVRFGQPFFVMELVKGVPLTDYCDDHKLSIGERLFLFVQICSAVQHAHQKGIIHRDLKPSNILVENHEGQAMPKVIDFGLAKATSGLQLSEHTLFTAYGTVAGTPLYMAPEQANFKAVDVDTRADVYALGVILYELLTGSTPISAETLKKAALDEIMRMIRTQEPNKPSTRLSSEDSIAGWAAVRQSDPRRLTKALRGDLDSIVMKALEKDRNRRYDTANGLSADVLRYLHGESVLAHPPSAGYRLRKFISKNRGPALAVCAVFLALVAGVVGTTLGLIEAKQQERIALAEAEEKEKARRAEAERALGELQAKLEAQKDRDDKVKALRAEAEQRLRADDEKRIAQAVRDFLQHKLLGLADVRTQADALLRAGALAAEARNNPTIRELLDRTASELAPDQCELNFPNQPLLQAEILQTVGNTYRGVGEYQTAIAFLKRSAEKRRLKLGGEHSDTLSALNDLGMAYQAAGQLTEAIELLQNVREIQNVKLSADHPEALATLNNLALAYQEDGKLRAAIGLFEQVRAVQEQKKLGAENSSALATLNNLAVAYLADKQTGKAIALFEQVRPAYERRGATHPDTLTLLSNLAGAHRAAGQPAVAIDIYEKLRPKFAEKWSAKHPDTLTLLNNLATAHQANGNVAEALRLLKQVRDTLAEIALPADHLLTLMTLNNLGAAYLADRQPREAIPLLEQAWAAVDRKLPADHQLTMALCRHLALAHRAAGNLKEAIPLFERLLEANLKKQGPGDESTLITVELLAASYRADGNQAALIRLYEKMRDAQKQAMLPADHKAALTILQRLAAIYRTDKEFTKLIDLFTESHSALAALPGADHHIKITTLANLAEAYRSAGKLPDASSRFEEAASAIAKDGFEHRNAEQIIASTMSCYEQWQQWGPSEPWRRKWSEVVRERTGAETPPYAIELLNLGQNLLKQQKWTDAESVLNECLTIRSEFQRDEWTTFNTKSLVGAALMGQGRYADATPLLLEGYKGMKEREASIPPQAKNLRLREAITRLEQLYEMLGRKDEAAHWRSLLDEKKNGNR